VRNYIFGALFIFGLYIVMAMAASEYVPKHGGGFTFNIESERK